MNTDIYICAFPATKEYNCFLDPIYRETFYDALNRIDGVVNLIDFNDIDIFDTEDFNDTDHLNDCGAGKITKLLNQIL